MPKGTAFEPYLYTIAGDEPQIIETSFFGEVDNRAALLLASMGTLGPGMTMLADILSDDQRSQWTRFIKSLLHRGPRSLLEIGATLERWASENMEREQGEAYRANRQPGDAESVYENAKRQSPSIVADAPKRMLPGLINEGPYSEIIFSMLWAVLDLSAAKHSLLTSDRPYLWSGDPVFLPISSTRLFVASNHLDRLDMLARSSADDLARKVSEEVVRQAVQNVYGNSPRRKDFVEKRLPRVPLPGLAALCW
jgi:hypothetical protein